MDHETTDIIRRIKRTNFTTGPADSIKLTTPMPVVDPNSVSKSVSFIVFYGDFAKLGEIITIFRVNSKVLQLNYPKSKCIVDLNERQTD